MVYFGQEDMEATGAESLLLEQKTLLQLIAMGQPLDDCLSALCSAVPRLSPGTRACILLADDGCRKFPRSISPDLLPSFGQGLKDAPINGLAIGTCGEALFRGRQVGCPNIAAEPKWSQPWRDLCISHGVMACVSEPILRSDGKPFGSFMLCFGEPREPTEWEQRMVRFGTHIASIALTREQTDRALIQSEERYRTLFESIDSGFCVIEMLQDADTEQTDFRLLEANPMFRVMTGLEQTGVRTMRDAMPDLGDDWFEIFKRVATGGEPVRIEKATGGHWYEVHSYQVDKPQDHRVAILFRDITSRKRNERNLNFLASISQDLTKARSVDAMMNTVGASVGRFLKLSTCAFVEINEEARHAVVAYDWHREDMENTLGVFPFEEFINKGFQSTMRAGDSLVIHDTATDPRAVAGNFETLKVRSLVCTPYHQDGTLRGCLAVTRSSPHQWREDEIDLVQRLTYRIWSRLENARIEEALHDSERKLRQIIEGAKDYAIFSLDIDGSISSWSPGAERLFGYKEKEIMGRPTALIFTPEDRANGMPEFEMSTARETGVADDERWHQRKDGSRFFASGLMQPIFDRAGQHTGFTKICRDRTAHQQSLELLERELTDSQRLQAISARLVAEGDFSNLLEEILHASIAITHSDMGTLQLVEGKTGDELRLLASAGFDPGVLIPFQRLRPEDETSCSTAIRAGERVVIADLKGKSEAEGNANPLHHRLVRGGVASAQWTPLTSRSGRLVGIIATHWREIHKPDERELRLLDLLARQAADLIERHQSEGALREREQQLLELSLTLERRVAQRTAELQNQTARLQSLAAELASAEQRERKRLAALLHDDLQQLLVAAGMQLGMVMDAIGGNAATSVRKAADWIDEARSAARDLTRQLRPPALYEDGLIAALHWLATEMNERHQLRVAIDGCEPVHSMSDDTKALLFECVRELLFNIAKYAGVDHAAVILWEENGTLQIIVEDSGVGFDVKTIGISRQKGGFGLFSIRERLTALGGEMLLISAPGHGTRIELHAPLADDADFRSPALKVPLLSFPDPAFHPDPPDSHSDTRIRVLIVDDHQILREGIANIIASDSRLLVSGQASDGVEALSSVEQHPPDVILMDVNMPRMNGIEATRKIRARWPAIRVIGMSVQDDPTTAKSICDAGAATFISKAGTSDSIIAAIVSRLPEKALASHPG